MPLTAPKPPDARLAGREAAGRSAAACAQQLTRALALDLQHVPAQVFSSPLHLSGADLFDHRLMLLRSEIRPEQLRSLCTLWAYLKLSGGHEIHQWDLASFELWFQSEEEGGQQPVTERALEEESRFSGLHACVFPDGEVSFYISPSSGIEVFASATLSLSQFWEPAGF